MITIFGAGLSGLIAARMLHEHGVCVMERASSLPNNHHAVLRFRSEVVGNATNIEFKKVNVIKGVVGGRNPVSDAVSYSLKVTGRLQARSVIDLRPVERYVAPPDLIARLASTADIAYDIDFESWSHNLHKGETGPIISTIPLPYMMDLFNWPIKPDFNFISGWTIRAKIDDGLHSSMNCTLYNVVQGFWYRATVNGEDLIIEGTGPEPDNEEQVSDACHHLGLPLQHIADAQLKSAKYQKISDLNFEGRESVREFIMWLSREHNIFSLGRFAVWRPKLMLDDLVKDVRVIQKLIERNDRIDQYSTITKGN